MQWSHSAQGKLGNKGLPTIEVATPLNFRKAIRASGLRSTCSSLRRKSPDDHILSIAEKSKLVFKDYLSEAEGHLEKVESAFQITRIIIYPKVVVASEDDVEKALKTLEKAEKYCLISNSMKTEVTIQPKVEVSEG